MQTLEEFKKWYKDNYDDSLIEYLADEYISEYNNPSIDYIKIGGKEIPIGDVSEIVDEWFEGNYIEESDLVNECCEWLDEYIKSIDEGKVLKLVKEMKVQEKKQALETDFTQEAT